MQSSKYYFDEMVRKIMPVFGKEEAKSIAFLFFEMEFGLNKTDILTEKPIGQAFDFEPIITRLLLAEPIQHIIGKAEFFGYQFFVNKHTLIPRPETEELVHLTIDFLKKTPKNDKKIEVLDIGTGTGCIAISIDKAIDNLHITAFDVSIEAIKIAQKNNNELNANVNFQQIDFLDENQWPEKKFDLIVSNPPYVTTGEKDLMHKNVLEYDPHLALFVPDEKPLIFYEKIAKFAKKYLSSNGKVLVEINEQFGEATSQCFVNQGFSESKVISDFHDKDRFVLAF
jgi:release factor glutamine methyltransferase